MQSTLQHLYNTPATLQRLFIDLIMWTCIHRQAHARMCSKSIIAANLIFPLYIWSNYTISTMVCIVYFDLLVLMSFLKCNSNLEAGHSIPSQAI